ncbi:hypothetical protein DL93DRAFT_2149101 [Clavulina sp. PMI_390]|nr:hypothetical protein DL93DRAFT_2149101 [Clavulina sp. PMI_390]
MPTFLRILCFFTFSCFILFGASVALSDGALHVRSPSLAHRRSEPIKEDISLSDTVLLASIDGRFHAVNRTNGRVKWSMQRPASTPPRTTTDILPDGPPLHNLVRSTHHDISPEDDDAPDSGETYIIEPQSGAIFVLPPGASHSTPLEKLAFTVPQLVDMSPFRLQIHGEQRMFLGRKETSFITLDLDTGEVISVDDADSCLWHERPRDEEDVLSPGLSPVSSINAVDEMRHRPKRQEIVVGRTDYHLTVRTDARKGVVQTLKFSVYGPNGVDRDLQERWARPPDGRYLQPLPDGRIFGFRPRPEAFHSFEWLVTSLVKPTVAVFDVVTPPGQAGPVILHQPRPTLHTLFPGKQYAMELSLLEERTFVGIIEDSLFAMSHANYPLVSVDYRFPAPTSGDYSSGTDLDVPLVERECTAHGCLVGNHASRASSAESRLGRLIEGRPANMLIESAPISSPAYDQQQSASTSTRVPLSLPTQHISHIPQYWESYWVQSTTLLVCVAVGYLMMYVRSFRPSARSHRFPAVLDKILPELPITELPKEESTPSLPETSTPAPAPAPVKAKTSVAFAESPPKPSEDDAGANGEESEGEGDEGGEGEDLKKKKRRRRGRKKPKSDSLAPPASDDPPKTAIPTPPSSNPPSTNTKDSEYVVIPNPVAEPVPISIPTPAPAPVMPVPAAPPPPPPSSLEISDVVLGYGSSGTVVYKGSFQGRSVAVKRLLQDFVTVASREVTLLQESDDHPNVIRYFYQEQRSTFLYIALELCPATLEDIIARPNAEQFIPIAAAFQPKRALAQITAGIRHLHELKIVHRDIKPQNILVSQAKNGAHRMLISDFGLCKKLGHDETSFLPTQHGPMGAGTVGWRAPEILTGEVRLDLTEIESLGSVGGGDSTIGSIGGASNSSSGGPRTRLTKSVDIFALGCLFFYTLTGGEHPYGGPFERESNIVKDRKDLSWLEKLGEEGEEARDLIERMLSPDPRSRPDTTSCLMHPFFWTPARRLGFLQDASDRFEIMERDPPERGLIALETGAYDVVGVDWQRRVDKIFLDNLGKFRKYNGKSIQDLMRAMRNKKHHYQDMPDNLKRTLGPLPDGFLSYFTRRFPRLFLHVYYVVANSHQLRTESMFKSYFELHSDA